MDDESIDLYTKRHDVGSLTMSQEIEIRLDGFFASEYEPR